VYFDVLQSFHNVTMTSNSTCDVTGEVITSLIYDVTRTCEESASDIRSECEFVFSELFNLTSWGVFNSGSGGGGDATSSVGGDGGHLGGTDDPTMRMTYFHSAMVSVTSRVRERLLVCFVANSSTPWAYPSLLRTLLMLLWETFKMTLVCCERNALMLTQNLTSATSSATTTSPLTSPSSSSSFSSSSIPAASPAYLDALVASSQESTVAFLPFILQQSGLGAFLPDDWNVTAHVQRSRTADACVVNVDEHENLTSSPVDVTYQVVFKYVTNCVISLEDIVVEHGEADLSHFTRRAVFNCCAVLVGISMAASVSVRVKNMADWIERSVVVHFF
jgi:hypothetical protein